MGIPEGSERQEEYQATYLLIPSYQEMFKQHVKNCYFALKIPALFQLYHAHMLKNTSFSFILQC